MKKIQFSIFVSLLVLLTVFLSAPAEALAQGKRPAKRPVKQAVKVTAPATGPTTGLLYKISGNGLKQPSYIFGTVHITCQDDLFSMETLNGYLGQADQLIMEIDMNDPAINESVAKDMVIPDGKTFTEFLTPGEYAKVDEFIKSMLGVSVETLKTIKPFTLEVLIVTNPKILGCSPPVSYELGFLQAANTAKKPVKGLDTLEFQTALLNKIPIDKQAKGLYKIAADPQKYTDNFQKIMRLYKSQDVEKLETLLEALRAENKEFADSAVEERNRTWIPKLEKEMKEKASFIAVGSGHLGGASGVIKLLRARGYILQPLSLGLQKGERQ